MTSATPLAVLQWLRLDADKRHRFRFLSTVAIAVVFVVAVGLYGLPYWSLALQERPHSPYHMELRPSGSIGLKLGMLGVACFAILFLYPIRKRWKWLSRIGKTKHWLDFHVICGITAPILITYHSAFKMNGLAGMAYWIMIAVALSGFIGRYLYSQIPRRLNASELSFQELESLAEEAYLQFEKQQILSRQEVAVLVQMPTRQQINDMSLIGAFCSMMIADLRRPLLLSALRRKFLTPGELIATCGGLLACSNQDLETVITSIRRQAWLAAKMAFLERSHQVFHLWHVVHRPFSYSFAVLITVHICVALLLGYY